MKSRSSRVITIVGFFAILLSSCLIAQITPRATAAPGVQASPFRAFMHAPPYKIVLSNSYIGNTWRVEMENEFRAACTMAPYKALVKCSWFNANNDVSSQTKQMDDIISSSPDAIVINAASPTGLNGVIAQACGRGILVVSYDNVVTAPCALKVNTDQFQFGKTLAQFLADNLPGHKGNVIMITGVAGTHVDQQRNAGADSVWAKYPGIHVIARYTGMWASGVAQTNTAAQLASLGKIDAIWCQGGTDGAIRALLAAHRPFPIPVAGEAENGFRQMMLQYKGSGFKAISIGQPPFLVLVSLELALEVLQGKHAKTDITIPFPVVTQNTVKEGETTFKSLASSFFADFTDSGPKATVKICVDAATKGVACPTGMSVHIP